MNDTANSFVFKKKVDPGLFSKGRRTRWRGSTMLRLGVRPAHKSVVGERGREKELDRMTM